MLDERCAHLGPALEPVVWGSRSAGFGDTRYGARPGYVAACAASSRTDLICVPTGHYALPDRPLDLTDSAGSALVAGCIGR